MKKILIIGVLAYLAYNYRDKIFGTSTPANTADDADDTVLVADTIALPLRQLTEKEAIAYADKYEDLKAAFGYDINKLQLHWFGTGYYEGRTVYTV